MRVNKRYIINDYFPFEFPETFIHSKKSLCIQFIKNAQYIYKINNIVYDTFKYDRKYTAENDSVDVGIYLICG